MYIGGGSFQIGGNTPYREATYLAKKGHDVTVVCQNSSEELEMDGIDIVQVQSHKKPYIYMRGAVEALILIKPFIYLRLSQIVKEKNPDILHVHDLPGLKTGTLVARRHDIPIVADMRDLYPESLDAWRGDNESIIELIHPYRFLRPSWRYKRLEKKLLHQVDAVITESDMAQRHYVDEYNVPKEKMTTIRNVPDIERLFSYPIKDVDIDGDFVVSYIGGFSRQRELDSAIDAMSYVVEEVPDAKLYLIGNGGGKYINELKTQRDKLGLEDTVIFKGWIDFEDLPSYTAASDVSLCLVQTDNKDSECALTNKLFQAMAFGVPVLITDVEAMGEIVEKENCGLITKSTDPKEISDNLLKLHRNPELAAELGENGREAVEREYNFEQEGKRLIEVYDRITKLDKRPKLR